MPKSDLRFGSFYTSRSNGRIYKLKPMNLPTPERQVETFEVKGRSGSLLIDYGSFNNVTLEAELALESGNSDTTISLFDDVRSAVMRQLGYQRLEDSDYPDEHRMARSVGAVLDTESEKNGKMTLTFDAKPQRYLNSGATTALTVTPTASGIDYIFGKGTNILNSQAIAILDHGVPHSSEDNFFGIDITDSRFANAATVKLVYETTKVGTVNLRTWGGTPLRGDNYQTGIGFRYSSEGREVSVPLRAGDNTLCDYFICTGDGIHNIEFYDSNNNKVASLYTGTGMMFTPDGVVGMSPVLHIKTGGQAVSEPRAILIRKYYGTGGAITIDDSARDITIGLDVPSTLMPEGVQIQEVVIDCETHNAYYRAPSGSVYNLNKYVTISTPLDFPADHSFEFYIGGEVQELAVTPKWWKI